VAIVFRVSSKARLSLFAAPATAGIPHRPHEGGAGEVLASQAFPLPADSTAFRGPELRARNL